MANWFTKLFSKKYDNIIELKRAADSGDSTAKKRYKKYLDSQTDRNKAFNAYQGYKAIYDQNGADQKTNGLDRAEKWGDEQEALVGYKNWDGFQFNEGEAKDDFTQNKKYSGKGERDAAFQNAIDDQHRSRRMESSASANTDKYEAYAKVGALNKNKVDMFEAMEAGGKHVTTDKNYRSFYDKYYDDVIEKDEFSGNMTARTERKNFKNNRKFEKDYLNYSRASFGSENPEQQKIYKQGLMKFIRHERAHDITQNNNRYLRDMGEYQWADNGKVRDELIKKYKLKDFHDMSKEDMKAAFYSDDNDNNNYDKVLNDLYSYEHPKSQQ